MIGAAFATLVQSFVAAFITPLVGLFTGGVGDVRARSFRVGDTAFPYGQFVHALLSFLIIAAVVYLFVVKPMQRLIDRFRTEPEPTDPVKECAECLSKIPVRARRCSFCTVEQLA